MRKAIVFALAFVMGACGSSVTRPTPPISSTESVTHSQLNVFVPAQAVTRRVYLTSVAPEALTVVQGPTPTEAGTAIVAKGWKIPLVCSCPGGRLNLLLETLTLGFVIDTDSRSGRAAAEATIVGDWNRDGEVDEIVLPPFEGELHLILREDEILGLRVIKSEVTSAGETAWQLEVSVVNDGSWGVVLDAFKSVSGMTD